VGVSGFGQEVSSSLPLFYVWLELEDFVSYGVFDKFYAACVAKDFELDYAVYFFHEGFWDLDCGIFSASSPPFSSGFWLIECFNLFVGDPKRSLPYEPSSQVNLLLFPSKFKIFRIILYLIFTENQDLEKGIGPISTLSAFIQSKYSSVELNVSSM